MNWNEFDVLMFHKIDYNMNLDTLIYTSGAYHSGSNAGIVGSNPATGMDVYVCLFCVCVVLCVGSNLPTDWSLVQGVLPSV
jgi:hypothetical protein